MNQHLPAAPVAAPAGGNRAKVFVSYSRTDSGCYGIKLNPDEPYYARRPHARWSE